MITCVTGFTRCGTSLVMRMLDAGGMAVTADNRISFESTKVLDLPLKTAWLKEADWTALKIVEPLSYPPPSGYDWRFILLARDPKEQAKSQIKLMRLLGSNVPDRALLPLAASLIRDYPKMLAALRAAGSVFELRFEDLLAHPQAMAEDIALYLRLPLDVAAMAAIVIPRSPACYDGMLEAIYTEAVPKEPRLAPGRPTFAPGAGGTEGK